MHHRIDHPADEGTVAEYGIDHALGYFVEVRRPKQRAAEYDRLHPGYGDLDGALHFLVKHGFFSNDALEDAKTWLSHEGGEGPAEPDVYQAAIVICHLKEWEVPTPQSFLAVATRLKVNQVRYGPNLLFHADEDRGASRQHLPDDECIVRFDSVWHETLGAAVASAAEIPARDAFEELTDKQRKFFDEKASHREFWLQTMKFIAQIADGELTQLWGIRSTDRNPRALFIMFETVEGRARFGEIASKLGWDAEALGLKLVCDFMDTVDRVKPPAA